MYCSSGKVLFLDIQQGLKWLNAMYPEMRIMWLMIIPWLAWWGAQNIDDVNKTCGALTWLAKVSAAVALKSYDADPVIHDHSAVSLMNIDAVNKAR